MLSMLVPRSLMSKQGIVMGMRPSFNVEGHLGPKVYHLLKSDLGSDCDQSPSLDPDWKRGNAKQVQSEWLRAAIAETTLNLCKYRCCCRCRYSSCSCRCRYSTCSCRCRCVVKRNPGPNASYRLPIGVKDRGLNHVGARQEG